MGRALLSESRENTLQASEVLARRYQWRGLSIAMKLALINQAFGNGVDSYELAKGMGLPESEIWNTLAKADNWGAADA